MGHGNSGEKGNGDRPSGVPADSASSVIACGGAGTAQSGVDLAQDRSHCPSDDRSENRRTGSHPRYPLGRGLLLVENPGCRRDGTSAARTHRRLGTGAINRRGGSPRLCRKRGHSARPVALGDMHLAGVLASAALASVSLAFYRPAIGSDLPEPIPAPSPSKDRKAKMNARERRENFCSCGWHCRRGCLAPMSSVPSRPEPLPLSSVPRSANPPSVKAAWWLIHHTSV